MQISVYGELFNTAVLPENEVPIDYVDIKGEEVTTAINEII